VCNGDFMKKKIVKKKEKVSKVRKAVDQRSVLINDVLNALKGEAKPSIIAYLASGQKRLTHIAEEIKGLSIRSLSSELKQLENHSLVKRTEVGTMPVIIEYELTAEGHALNKIMGDIYTWALAKHTTKPVG
jgi:DNA-binding HxlR family transcriptional regulator